MTLSRGTVAGIAVVFAIIVLIAFNILLYRWVKRTRSRHPGRGYNPRSQRSVGVPFHNNSNASSGASGSGSGSVTGSGSKRAIFSPFDFDSQKAHMPRADRERRNNFRSQDSTSVPMVPQNQCAVPVPEPTYDPQQHHPNDRIIQGGLVTDWEPERGEGVIR